MSIKNLESAILILNQNSKRMVKGMDLAQQEEQKRKAKEYEKYVKERTPVHSLFLNMLGAFIS